MPENTMPEKKFNALKVLKIFSLVILYAIIGILLIFAISTLSRKKEDQIPNVFGFGFLAVHELADSMTGDNPDSFNPNDLIFVKVLTKKEKANLDLEKLAQAGAVISFYDRSIKRINTHRVVEYRPASGNTPEYIRTQGDKAGLPIDPGLLEAEDVIAIYTGKVPKLGKAINFMQSPIGFAVVVVLPMLVLLIYQSVSLIINIYKVKEDKLKESQAIDREAEIERLRRELLEQMRKEEEGEQ